ncbi:orotidine 5'-phosphate decarboxylase [Actinomycetes bacterium]|nr:orotidine 5'-phosphate decarboxylase [Actinomycetes bacterium]
MPDKSPIILAVDTTNLEVAKTWIAATQGSISIYKIGLEFFLKLGSAGIIELRKEFEFELFLDLKLHDIPNTVAGAARSLQPLAPDFVTVHAAGGAKMVAAAAAALPDSRITGVTILTSLDESDVKAIGYKDAALESAVNLAKIAVLGGAKAVVCSPLEVSAIRNAIPKEILLITPGVRPIGSGIGDQSRVMTPTLALESGADYLVIGRPITEADDPGKAAAAILDSL